MGKANYGQLITLWVVWMSGLPRTIPSEVSPSPISSSASLLWGNWSVPFLPSLHCLIHLWKGSYQPSWSPQLCSGRQVLGVGSLLSSRFLGIGICFSHYTYFFFHLLNFCCFLFISSTAEKAYLLFYWSCFLYFTEFSYNSHLKYLGWEV